MIRHLTYILLAALTLFPVGGVSEATSGPIIQRFENGHTEYLGGRLRRTVLSVSPVNYQLQNGAWVPITNQIGDTGVPGMGKGVDEFIQFRIATTLAGQSPVLHIGRGATHIKVAVLSTNTPTPGVVNGQSIRFNEAWNGADLEYVVAGHFIKENIYLKTGHPTSFAFRIDSHQGFDPQTLTFGKFTIQPPILQKAGGIPVRLSWVVSQQGGKTILTVNLPIGNWVGWVLDPTTILQPDSAGFDTYIRSTDPTGNVGTSTFLQLGDNSGNPDKNRPLIKFDVSSIDSGDTVSSATLSLFEFGANNENGGPASWDAEMRRLLENWVEGEATWNIYSTGNNWTTAGADSDANDRVAGTSATLGLDPTAASAFVDWTGATLDDDVQKFVDGTYSNFGWVIEAPTAEGAGSAPRAWNQFRSSDYTTALDRPKLVVVHTSPVTGFPHSYGTIIGN